MWCFTVWIGSVSDAESAPCGVCLESFVDHRVSRCTNWERVAGHSFWHGEIPGICIRQEDKVETDHKPLKSVARKNLLNTLKCLQCMLLWLQKYDIDILRKGYNIDLAYTLSRAFLPVKSVRSTTETAAEHMNPLMFVPLSDDALSRIRIATEADAQLQQLSRFVQLVWPDKSTELTVWTTAVIVLKGECVKVPHSLRHDLIEKSHSSHIGIQGSIRRARESLY